MLNDKSVVIVGEGQVICALCPQKKDEDDNPVKRDGVAVEIDGSESTFCWKHLRAMVTMLANARRRQPKEPLEALDIGNGR